MAALNYARLPGYGDLAGDSRHPGSPEYVEPEFGADDALELVSARLEADDEVTPVLADLTDACFALRWIAENVEFPDIVGGRYVDHRAKFRALLERAEGLENAVAAEMERAA